MFSCSLSVPGIFQFFIILTSDREYEEMIILYKHTVLHSPNFREFQLLVLWEHVFEHTNYSHSVT